MTSVFDPKSFLDATLTAPTEKRNPLPVNNPERPDTFYLATVKAIDSLVWEGKGDHVGKSGIRWNVPVEVQVPMSLRGGETGLGETLTIKDSVMIDLTEGGTIDNSKGKNNRLRMYRDAVDLNKPGDSFSARRMENRMILVQITHEEWQGAPQERIGKVLKPS